MFYPISVRWLLLAVFLLNTSVYAGFEEATEAYLLGDFEKARYEALVSAMDGRPEAQMLMGQLYLNGEGVGKDISLAIYWYEKAAEQGFSQAQFLVGSMHYEGKVTAKNYQKAWRWLSEALKSGNLKTQAMLDNLLQLENGDVVNITESLTVLEQAANRGERKAQLLLAKKRLAGNDVKQDKTNAVQVITEIAKGGYINAQKYLGELYTIGDGVTQDYIEAYAWSMAYAGTNKLGGLIREGKQTARLALRKLDESKQNEAYLQSKKYFEQYVLPFHPNARPVGPNEYRIIVHRAGVKKPAVKPVAASATEKKPAGVSNAKTKGGEGGPSTTKSAPVNTLPGSKTLHSSADKINSESKSNFNDTTGSASKNQAVSTDRKATGDAGSTKVEAKPVPDTATGKSEKSTLSTATRSADAVNLTLETNKLQIDSYFSQAQEEDNALNGRIEFEIRIEPSGDVSDITIIVNELESPILEQQLIDHLKNLKFGEQKVQPYTYVYPLVLLPR